MNSLDNLLGAIYHAQHKNNVTAGVTEDALVTALRSDSALASEAQAKFASITDNVAKQCYISKVYRDILNRVIPKV